MSLIRNKLPDVWQAKWIDPEPPHDPAQRQPASILRRVFTAAKTENAFLYITCHGLYEARLNGRRVGDFVLAPGTGDYSRRLTVQCYKVSDLLREGENELTVTLGDGWYRGSVGIDGLRNYYGGDRSAACRFFAATSAGKPARMAQQGKTTCSRASAMMPGWKRSATGMA